MSASFPLAPFVRSFFEDHLGCQRNVSRNTIRGYRDAVKLLLHFAAAHLNRPATRLLVTDISEAVTLAFLADLEQVRGNTIQTRNHRLTVIRSLFDYIGAREPLLLDHCRQVVTIPQKRGAAVPEIRYLEKAEVTALLEAVPREGAWACRDYALLLFLYNTGARVQEAADVRVSWVTLTAPCKVQLFGKGSKWRTCPLWDSTAAQLRQWNDRRGNPAGAGDCLFTNRSGKPLSRSGIADIVQRYASKAATVEPGLRGRRVTPHVLRHTTAIHLLQSGVEVNVIRSWLGHVSISTTNHYIEIDLARKAQALEKCEIRPKEPPEANWRSDPELLSWLESL